MLMEIVVAVVVVVVVSVKMWYTYTSGRCTSTRSMAGKTVIITGGTAGIGKETARDLFRRGARVIIACRNLTKGNRMAGELRGDEGGVGEVVVRRLDTSDLSSVRAFAKDVLDTEKAIHVLINNAGILAPYKREVTADGLELTMATNHFGHFLLTNLLLGRLKESAPSRIINVSSFRHHDIHDLDLEDLSLKNNYEMHTVYSISKLCNILFSLELSNKLAGTGVTTNSLNPGIVWTNLFDTWRLTTYLKFLSLFLIMSKDPVLGAQTNIHLAVSEEVEGVTGCYFSDCKKDTESSLARRKDLASMLWKASSDAVGINLSEIHY